MDDDQAVLVQQLVGGLELQIEVGVEVSGHLRGRGGHQTDRPSDAQRGPTAGDHRAQCRGVLLWELVSAGGPTGDDAVCREVALADLLGVEGVGIEVFPSDRQQLVERHSGSGSLGSAVEGAAPLELLDRRGAAGIGVGDRIRQPAAGEHHHDPVLVSWEDVSAHSARQLD